MRRFLKRLSTFKSLCTISFACKYFTASKSCPNRRRASGSGIWRSQITEISREAYERGFHDLIKQLSAGGELQDNVQKILRSIRALKLDQIFMLELSQNVDLA